MNKMHQAAKIAFVTLAIYFIVTLVPGVFAPITMIINNPLSLERVLWPVVSFAFSALYIWLIVHFLIVKRDKWAKKIVGDIDAPTSTNPAAWLPFSYRLACIAAGLFIGYRIVWNVIYQSVNMFIMYSGVQLLDDYLSQVVKRNLASLLLLPLAIYLLCGAPHFVRWQVKKTLAICTEFSENNAGPK